MGFLVKFKAYLYAGGAAILAALAFFFRTKMLKDQRDRYKEETEVLKARVRFNKQEKKIKKENKQNLSVSLEETERKIKEKRYEDIKNLVDPNNPDNW